MGLAWRLAPEPELFKFAHETAERIARLPANSVQDLKRGFNACAQIEQALSFETVATVKSFFDPETADRVKNFDR